MKKTSLLITQISMVALLLMNVAPLSAADKITASYGAISGTMAPIWVAKEARLFEK